ncbi:MAG: hypothetical protein A2W03_16250 [Candidatus Aminicenantes bacterium RBG_16_63_16]|nr:MAG: hypothetical protein A2W03_16250 [Candidatus Aminicenantes bacterium RBG_16_63_16]
MRKRHFLSLVAVPWLCVQAAGAGQSAKIINGARQAVATMKSHPKDREAAAEAAAARFLAGGRLLAAGSIPLFDVEWTNRSGGLMPAAALKDPGSLSAADVLVYGCFAGSENDDAARLSLARAKGALVIAFGTREQAARLRPAADFFRAAELPAGTPLPAQTAACLNIAQLWAFTGDLVAACTRAGKMPAMWQSIKVPGSTERNSRYRQLRFHDGLPVKPVPPGVLGNQYLTGLIRSLDAIAEETRPFQAAAGIVRGAAEAKRTVFHANLGHFEPARLLQGGFPIRVATLPLKSPEAELQSSGAAGDALFIIWYHEMPVPLLDAARERGLSSIVVAGRNPFSPLDTRLAEVYIDPKWVVGDAIAEVPGYDIRILPPSAVLNGLVFYAVIAEALPSSSS